MDATLTSVRENPLLGRREVEVEVNHEGEPTPSKEDIKSRVAAENDLDAEKIEVESVYTGYGENTSRGTLKVYEEFEYDEELEEKPEEEQTVEPEKETTEVTEEYEEIVSGTITEAKDALGDMDEPDFEAALEAEKDNKDRKTLKDWLENQIE
ncbi:MAG: small subunit ribosomal protein S24e [Candidatus Nanohaloarchaea archaeon]|jgi:small subunit ribosomal protein S24e